MSFQLTVSIVSLIIKGIYAILYPEHLEYDCKILLKMKVMEI
jgi:hypothetical protein